MGVALIQHHMGTVGIPLVRDRRVYKLQLNCVLLLIQWHTGEHLPTAADQTVSKTPNPKGRRVGDHTAQVQLRTAGLGLVNESSEDRDIN